MRAVAPGTGGVRLLLVGMAAWGAAASCAMPTDRAGGLTVQVTGLPAQLLVGDTARATARVTDDAGRVVPNAAVVFTSSDEAVLTVDGAGLVGALAAGTADVRAVVQGQAAVQASGAVRVRPPVAVDSVTPDSLSWGDTLVVYGVSADPAGTTVLLGGVRATLWRAEPIGADGRENRFVVWAPVGAPSASAVTLRVGAATSTAADSVQVVQQDRYEPNDGSPGWNIGPLGGEGFYNPQLAVEPSGTDYFFVLDSASRDRTVTFAGYVGVTLLHRQLGTFGTQEVVQFDGERGAYRPGCGADANSLLLPWPSDTLRVPYAALPSGTFVVKVGPTSLPLRDPLRYVLGLANGATTALPPDSLENNDFCGAARPVTIGDAPRGLNIHGTYDVDLVSIQVDTAMLVRIRATFAGPQDIDFVMGQVSTSTQRPWWSLFGQSTSSTSEEMVVQLAPARYLLMLYSYYATPMYYTLSIEPATAAEVAAFEARPPATPRPEDERRHWVVQRPAPVEIPE